MQDHWSSGGIRDHASCLPRVLLFVSLNVCDFALWSRPVCDPSGTFWLYFSKVFQGYIHFIWAVTLWHKKQLCYSSGNENMGVSIFSQEICIVLIGVRQIRIKHIELFGSCFKTNGQNKVCFCHHDHCHHRCCCNCRFHHYHYHYYYYYYKAQADITSLEFCIIFTNL